MIVMKFGGTSVGTADAFVRLPKSSSTRRRNRQRPASQGRRRHQRHVGRHQHVDRGGAEGGGRR